MATRVKALGRKGLRVLKGAVWLPLATGMATRRDFLQAEIAGDKGLSLSALQKIRGDNTLLIWNFSMSKG